MDICPHLSPFVLMCLDPSLVFHAVLEWMEPLQWYVVKTHLSEPVPLGCMLRQSETDPCVRERVNAHNLQHIMF